MVSTKSVVFIWDFDKTMVLDDTDSAAVGTLGPDVLRSHLHDRELIKEHGWTEVMNKAFRVLHSRGFTADDILKASTKVCFPASTVETLRRIHANACTESAIMSDSNSGFINACLDTHKVGDCIQSGMFTNDGVSRGDGSFSVVPYTALGEGRAHRCAQCPSNLCKGEVFDEFKLQQPSHCRFVYIGDGRNDFCPVRRLGPDDAVLSRAGLSLSSLIDDSVAAQHDTWDSPEELQKLVFGHLPIS